MHTTREKKLSVKAPLKFLFPKHGKCRYLAAFLLDVHLSFGGGEEGGGGRASSLLRRLLLLLSLFSLLPSLYSPHSNLPSKRTSSPPRSPSISIHAHTQGGEKGRGEWWRRREALGGGRREGVGLCYIGETYSFIGVVSFFFLFLSLFPGPPPPPPKSIKCPFIPPLSQRIVNRVHLPTMRSP